MTVLLVSCVQKAQQPEQAIDPNIETQEDQPFQQEGEEIIEQDVEPEQNTQEDLTQGETSEVRCGDGVCASSETEED
ncbi:hypothetical protein COV16_06890, partial [Candidatus Woesearchaeota archaeon CG10_big_fil_rev_8_21_14_0_10_34_8]